MRNFIIRAQAHARWYCALYFPRYADASLHYNVNERPVESVLTTEIPEMDYAMYLPPYR